MEAPRKRRKLSPEAAELATIPDDQDGESTDFKLAILASLHPDRSQDVLLDYLLAYNGSIEDAGSALSGLVKEASPRKPTTIGYQSSLSTFATKSNAANGVSSAGKQLTKKGRTLHLYVRCARGDKLGTLLTKTVA